MKEPRIKASGAGEMLAGLGPGGLDAEQATSRVRRWRAAGVIPAWGEDRAGRTSPFFFTMGQCAIVAVMFALHDRAGIVDAPHLKRLYDALSRDSDGRPGDLIIDRLLADIEAGNAPELWVFTWKHRVTGKEVTTVHPRFEHELTTVGVRPPGRGFEPVLEGRLPLAPILARFCDADMSERERVS